MSLNFNKYEGPNGNVNASHSGEHIIDTYNLDEPQQVVN